LFSVNNLTEMSSR